MKESSLPNPPRWLDRLIELYCRPELLEDLQGDLHEYYQRNCSKKGKSFANLIFLIDVIKFFRLYTIRTPKVLGQMSFIHLSKNYFKTSIRSLARNKLFSTINIVGLAISMSIGILMITYLSQLLSYDQFHEKKDRIYRVNSTYSDITGTDPFDLGSNSVFLGKKLREEMPDLEEVLIMRRNFRRDFKKGDNVIPSRGLYAEAAFFKLFSFELLEGDPETALLEPYSLVLTESVAKKLFGDEPVLGQIVHAGEESFTVTGLMADVPFNSHMQFKVLCSFKTAEVIASKQEQESFNTWRSIWMNHVYVLLPEGYAPEALQSNLDRIAAGENATRDRYTITFQLQNLTDMTPGPELSNNIGPTTSWLMIWQLGLLIGIVIASSCFNYTNLSIARSLRRMKEVGIRKVVGANRPQVFAQFVFEAVILSVLALILAFGLYQIIKPSFVQIALETTPMALEFEWIHALYFIAFAIVIGFMAGGLPAWMLSKVKAISIIQDSTSKGLIKGINFRKALIVFQFVISMALIIAATIDYRQYKYSINFDLGFKTDNVVNMLLYQNEPELFLPGLQQIPEIQKISMSGMLPNTGEQWGDDVKYKDPMDSVDVHVNYVSKDYIDLHELQFVAGTTFPFDDKDSSQFVVIDESLRKRLGFSEPADAVGELLTLDQGRMKLQITGVINDYQYTKIVSESKPSVLIQGKAEDFTWINLQVNAADPLAFMTKLEKVFAAVDKVHTFEALYYKERIEHSYRDFQMQFKVFTFLALLAISIASMGLLGMAVFTAETRMKEISVRKVLGASSNSLFYLLSKGFLRMFLIAALIAMPFSYFFFEQMVLVDFVNRVTVNALDLMSGVLVVLVIGLSTIAWQTRVATRANPANVLRIE